MRTKTPNGLGAGRLGTALLFLAVACCAHGQQSAGVRTVARPLIKRPLVETNVVRLPGNTRPEANSKNDRGRVADRFALEHMQVLLKRAPEREQALRHYIDELHDPASPNWHRWLTADQFGEQYGAAQSDIDTIVEWLTSHGFRVNSIARNRMMVDFSGTAVQAEAAFGIEIHNLNVNGVQHFANMSDPQVPDALADAVTGIVSLHDFYPQTMRRPRAQYTTSSGYRLVAPADLATIYNLTPLFNTGISGQGQAIAVIGDSNVYTATDWTTFRSAFGLSEYTSGSFTQVHPAPISGGSNCVNPGVTANSGEVILDAEWASAAAPSAAIVLASCRNYTTFGGLIALQNLLNGSSTPPAIVSISYGACEAQGGAAFNAAFNSAYQQAVAQGVSVFVASGDYGAAGCDMAVSAATHGIGVNGLASTPYNVAVGGTDFGDQYAGSTGSYWSSTNTAAYGSALSYIPEIPWNNSCAGSLLASYYGYGVSYGTGGFCNSTPGQNYLMTYAGSGGPSACASGAASVDGVVSGTCAGTAKPGWQSGIFGNPADGVRDLPDVSLFAANGLWSHYLVYCWSDTAHGGVACSGVPSSWSGAGGTSFSAPIMAGIQALVNQRTGRRQGNPNPVYYAMASGQYGSTGSSNCNSSKGNTVGSNCIFYDVTQGDITVNCTGAYNCYLPSGTYGVLSTSSSSFNRAYAAGPGWDMATGIGTVNAYNLVTYWNVADLSLSATALQIIGGTSIYHVTVSNAGPTNASGVMVTTTLPAGITLDTTSSSSACSQSGQIVTCTAATQASGASLMFVIVVKNSTSSAVQLSFSGSSNNADSSSANNTAVAISALPTFADLLKVQQFLLGRSSLSSQDMQRLDLYPSNQGDGSITFADWLKLQSVVLGY